MKFKKTKYRIADTRDGSREVIGYAVLTKYPVRFAVREILDGMLWCADHWDTGFRFAYGHSRAEAAQSAVEQIQIRGIDAFAKAAQAAKSTGGLNAVDA